MQQIIIQPARDPAARLNYSKAVEGGVDLDVIKQHTDSGTYNKILSYYQNTKAKAWGLTPGTTKKNSNSWERINTGDIVLFLKNKMVYSSATVVLKVHEPKLAKAIWGLDNKSQTWEYMYFLDELKHQTIPTDKIVKLIGQKAGQKFQFTQVIKSEVSERVLSEFDLASETYQPVVDYKDYTHAISKLSREESLETRTSSLARVEQAFLRKTLFEDKKYSQCGICNKQYPVEFLFTAHIKKRSCCTDAEKIDLNIVMPMCKFGCDDLYEKGYIGVEKGKVYVATTASLSEPILDYLRTIEGNECKYWDKETEQYFQWHNSQLRI